MDIELFGNSILSIFDQHKPHKVDLTFDDSFLIASVQIREYDLSKVNFQGYDFIIKETKKGFIVETAIVRKDLKSDNIHIANFKNIQEVNRYVDIVIFNEVLTKTNKLQLLCFYEFLSKSDLSDKDLLDIGQRILNRSKNGKEK